MEFTHTDIEPYEIVIKLEKCADAKTETTVDSESKLDLQNDLPSYEKNDQELSLKVESENVYCEDGIFNDFDDDDDNYEPEKKKTKTKKTKLKRITRSNSKSHLEDKLIVKADDDISEKITAKRKQFSKNQTKLKDRILKLLKSGEFQDLGANVTMNEEIFLKMFEKCEKSGLRSMLPLKPGQWCQLSGGLK